MRSRVGPVLQRALGRRAASGQSASPVTCNTDQQTSASLLEIIRETGPATPTRVMPLQLVDGCAARMDAYQSSHAIVQETLSNARDEAAAAEMMRNTGRTRSMLDGIPLALKGNWALKGVPMNTQRTGLLRDHTPAASATLVDRLAQAGSAFAGKAYVNEFGIGAVEMVVQADAVLSPWYSSDERAGDARFVGGRSGGPATAVATGMAYGAASADLGGTLRLPAAYSGTVGLMASRARLPQRGLLTVAPDYEASGVVAQTVADAALLMAFMQGKDGCKRVAKLLDVAADKPQQVMAALPALLGLPEGETPLQGLRIGVVDVGKQGVAISSAQAEALEHGVEYLTKSGAAVHQEQLPDLAEGVAAFYYLATGQVLDDKDGLGSMLSGLGFDKADTSAEVMEEVCSILRATRERGLEVAGHGGLSAGDASHIGHSFRDAMIKLYNGKVDLLLLPSAPGAAPTVGDAAQWGNEQLLAADSLSVPATLAGMPAISVPVALTSAEGLPLGLQLIAAPTEEARLLAAAHVIEHQAQRHSAAGGQLAPLKKPGEGKAPINTV